MVLKRKRNLKIDVTSTYAVFLLRDLDKNETEDYIESRDTGMEAEEEKELHLQNIIKGTGKEIPIPVILEVENVSRSYFEKKNLKRKIVWEKDCPNEYIEDRNEFEKMQEIEEKLRELMEKNGQQGVGGVEKGSFIPIEALSVFNTSIEPSNHQQIQTETENKIGEHGYNELAKRPLNSYKIDNKKISLKDVIKKIGNDKNSFAIKDDEIINFCLKKTLIRYEKAGFEAYICFRDRIFNPTFKSRRNETLMLEKINRMGVEFNTLKKLCEIYKEKCIDEDRMYCRTIKIFRKLSNSNISKRRKKILVKMMYKHTEKGPGSKVKINIYDLMSDRQKIINLKNMKSTNELYLDIKYYNEVMNIITADENEAKKTNPQHTLENN